MNKQLTEDYCSFEIAKLLKEKGFDGESHKHYWGYETGKEFLTEGSFNPEYDYAAPTQSLALKWLRKVHNIVLDIAFEANKGWTFYVSHLIIGTISDGSTYIVGIQHSVWSDDVQQPYYKEYEEAVDAALLYVLKNLI